jgi:hypothetical protein
MDLIAPPSSIEFVWELQYTAPYSQESRGQLFALEGDALGMKTFYESCGTACTIKKRTVNVL